MEQNVHCIALDGVVTQDVQSESREAFSLLVARFSRFVFRVAYAITRNPQDAEDVVQDTFLKLYRTGAWKSMQDEKAFLARTTWRLAVDRRSAQTKYAKRNQTSARSPEDPEMLALRADGEELLHVLIDGLPDELRVPLALSALDDLTSAEIARMLQVPEGTVRSRVARARALLKEKYDHIAGARNARS